MDEKTHRDVAGAQQESSFEQPVPSGKDIRAMRQKANLSQATFAQYLQLSAGYVSQLERGVKRPMGATVLLLNLIGRRGIDAIL
jgi:putative transcriptional regulator